MQAVGENMHPGVSELIGDVPFVLLEFAGRDQKVTPLAFRRPERVVVAETLDQVRPALRQVEQAAAGGKWAAGYVAYESAAAWEPAVPARPSTVPLVWFGIFAAALRPQPADVEAYAGGRFDVGPWRASVERERYADNISAVRDAIARGETYQANYTFRLRTRLRGDAWGYYHRLRAAQRAGYAAYLDTGQHVILCASPELFFRRDGNTITARPMKGTARRGRRLDEDQAQAAMLAHSTKNRAENLMILDLLRNDIGRVAETGSVRVPQLFSIERYPTVWQMTSTVEATLGQGTSLEALFAALFPCGSVTGAPKISTMQLLAQLEGTPRGVYCGALGYVAPGGDCVFNVPIRTVVVEHATGLAEFGVGGGITWDSNAADEYDETVAKAALLSQPPFELLETLLLEDGEYALLERHLERMSSSARFWDFPIDSTAVRARLEQLAIAHAGGSYRARVRLARDGRIGVEAHPLDEPGAQPLPVALASRPVDRGDPFLSNKTTHRAVYEAHRAEHPAAYDVLLHNQDGELTEFCTGNLLLQLDGRCWTPPLSSGLLAGTLRAELLERGEIAERVLLLDDLARAEAIWLINSVRGRLRVELIDPRIHANRRNYRPGAQAPGRRN